MSTKEEILKSFNVDSETYDKSKDIKPVFDLGKMEVGDKVYIEFLNDSPKKVSHKNKFRKSDSEPETIETPVIEISVYQVIRKDNEEEKGYITVPFNKERFSLWLSSSSLRIGLSRLSVAHAGKLKGVKAIISVSEADYKKFGKNRCYNVSEIVDVTD